MFMTHNIVALVPAAGSGKRLGADVPKVLLPLGEQTIIEKTVQTLSESGVFSAIVVIAPKEYLDQFSKLNLSQASVIAGGESRSESVRCGLRFLQNSGLAPDFVLIHDGARCFVDQTLILNCIDAAINYGAVTAAVPVSDSLKEIDQQQVVSRSIARDYVCAVQTPQVFSWQLIIAAHKDNAEGTDDASLVERLHQVKVVKGDERNTKITTKYDYELAKLRIALSAAS